MSNHFERVKEYLMELDLPIVEEDAEKELIVVEDEDNGIKNLVIDCEDPILIIEQLIINVPDNAGELFKRLLQMNRNMVHGAFAVDEDSKYIFFRDTLQIENLDKNELEGSISALSLALAENSEELLKYSK